MIGSILQIVFGIPYGVFFHRNKLRLAIAYMFMFVAILAICSLIDYGRVATAINSVTLTDYLITLLQFAFGAGIGACSSALAKRLGK